MIIQPEPACEIAQRHLVRPRPRDAQAGLGAFEDAPCFLEIVERAAQSYREGAEISGERNE